MGAEKQAVALEMFVLGGSQAGLGYCRPVAPMVVPAARIEIQRLHTSSDIRYVDAHVQGLAGYGANDWRWCLGGSRCPGRVFNCSLPFSGLVHKMRPCMLPAANKHARVLEGPK